MLASEVIRKLKSGELTSLLQTIYIEKLEEQQKRYQEAIQSFMDYFGDQQIMIFSVPGKCEIGGNNTDHQHGHVLATATHLDSIAVVSKQERYAKVIYNQLNINGIDTENMKFSEAKKGSLESLITGVLYGLKEHYHIGGFVAYIQSDIPRNVGLGSSANLEIMIGTIMNHLYNEGKIEKKELVHIGRYASDTFYDKKSGYMNECVCCFGGFIKIDFQDLDNPDIQKLDIDFSHFDYALCAVNTHTVRDDYVNEYNLIPEEMTKVAHFFKKEVLREVPYEDFVKNFRILRLRMGDRAALRALHFFKEEDRVIQQSEALESGDFQTFLDLVRKSNASSFECLQNIYSQGDGMHQNIGTAIALTENHLQDDGVAKINGGGFSGTILTFVKKEKLEDYLKFMDSLFGKNACYVIHSREQGAIRLL